MRVGITFIIISLTLFSCQSEFSSPGQAFNEVTRKAQKDGRWIEYLGENQINKHRIVSNEYNSTKHTYYRLIEYKRGIPSGLVREFRMVDSSLAREYNLEIDTPSTLTHFGKEKYNGTLTRYTSDGKVDLYADYNYESRYVTLNRITYKEDQSKEIWKYNYHYEIPEERQKNINQIQSRYLDDNDYSIFQKIQSGFLYYSKSTKIKVIDGKEISLKHDLSIPEFKDADFDTTLDGILTYLKRKSDETKNELSYITLSNYTVTCSNCWKNIHLHDAYYGKYKLSNREYYLKKYIHLYLENDSKKKAYFDKHIGKFYCSKRCYTKSKNSPIKERNKYDNESSSNSYSNSSRQTQRPQYKSCSKCSQSQRFTIWKGYSGWKNYNETKLGWVKCSGCRGYGYNESYHGNKNVTRKQCRVSSCVNGWSECRKCYGTGKVKNSY